MHSVGLCYNRQRLIDILRRDALKLGSFKLASGRMSHYYVDGRRITLSSEGAASLPRAFWTRSMRAAK